MKRVAIAAVTAGLAAIAFPVTAAAQAENYEPYRIDLGVSAAYTHGLGAGGPGGVVEAKYLFMDEVAAGLRLDGAAMFGGSVDSDNGGVDVGIGAVASTLLKGEYLLGDGGARPFAGLGIGMYTIASQSVSAGEGAAVDQRGGRYFGIAPQIGADLGRARLALTYNAIIGASVEVQQSAGTGGEEVEEYSQDYLTLDFTFRIGGDRTGGR